MISRQLRAKYQIEQYPVIFQFPGFVLGTPSINVEIVSGEDPLKDSFAGLPIIRDELVSVIVVGGLPGVVYRITCTAAVAGADDEISISGIVAVKPTHAETPDGAAPIPLANALSTPPYPIYVLDEIGVIGEALNGVIVRFPLDEIGVTGFALDGVHRDLIVEYTYGPENISVASVALNGSKRLLLVSYIGTPENIEVVSFALNGSKKVILIQYLNYAPEDLEVTSFALNGTHGTI